MAYVTRQDNGQEIKIHYKVYGKGEPIIFHHGNGNRASDWLHLGYVDALKDDFQLIMLDLRGHGDSSKPHDPESYKPESCIGDTIAVLDDVGIEKAHFLGGSYAATFCFFAARYCPERVKSYLFFTPGIPFSQVDSEELKQCMLEGADSYLAKLEAWFGKFEKPFLRETFLANDGKALWALNSSEWIDYKDYIQYIDKPSLIYTGSDEPINPMLKALAERLPDCEYHEELGLGHAEAYWRSELAAPVIRKFVNMSK